MSVAAAHSPSQSFDDTLVHRPISLVHHASSPAVPQTNITTPSNAISSLVHSSTTNTSTTTTPSHTNINHNNANNDANNNNNNYKSPSTTLTQSSSVDTTHYDQDDNNNTTTTIIHNTDDEQAQPTSDLSPPTTPVPSNPYATDPRDPLSLPQPSTASKRSFATSSSTNLSCHKENIPPSQHSRAMTIDSAETEPVRPPYSSSTISSSSSDIVHKDMRLPKRYSTSHNLHAKRAAAAAANKSRALTRHNTTGHPLQHPVEPERRLSEDFEKELTARRKAFRRLSRRRNDDNDEEDRVLFGTRIAEGHRNYILMYNMLTGIRIAVGRVSAKIDRPLTENDFDAAHKLAFDVMGDELTPGAKYDFKFKDYSPWVFRSLRQKFGIDPADYLISLTSKYILSELGSPGKSGSFFYYSRDYRFIIKTIHHSEHKYLRKILRSYHDHVCENPDTLLCRYYGLHRVKLPRGRKIHFVVMGNVLPPNKDVHETYDLKGSTLGRFLPEEKIKENPYAVLKDLNWEATKKKLHLGPVKRQIFVKQLIRDVRLLIRLNIMDYSLMIGIHDMFRGNKDNVRDSTLQSFQPDTKRAEHRASLMRRRQSKAQVVRKAIAAANPDRLDTSELPNAPLEERQNCIFYSDDGGFQATDEEDRPAPVLYFLGIIDILTPYDSKKKSEHFFKSLTQDKHAISSVKPSEYGNRFMGFMANAIEHNQDVPHDYQLDK